MAERILPGIGLTAFWDLGYDGWKAAMDNNLLLASVLTQGRALSKVAVEPGAPANGDIHLLDETHATQANKIAVRDNGAWVYIAPQTGWKMYDVAAGVDRRFNGAVWVAI
jgi:hypothetical protein